MGHVHRLRVAATLHWWVIAAGLGATVLIGAIAGLYPAIRAARTPPTAALASQ